MMSKMPGPELTNPPQMTGVRSKGDAGYGPPIAPTTGLERNPLLDAIMKLKTIGSPFDGLGVLESS
jgi:hypothetical protein